jgi:NADPH:quinone reductase-like Zn-dependent oxidoreductase
VTGGTTKAIVQDRYGSPDVLELKEIERPSVGEQDVLVRVHAAGVEQGVWHLMAGLPYLVRVMGFGLRAPKIPVRGMDVAGVVEAVGGSVTGLRPGDEVFGTCDGSFAEYARTEEERLAPKPANLSFEQAAAVPISGCTALQGLRDSGELRAGQRALIVGAGGGVGTFAIQLARAFGAEVTGVCSTAKLDLVRSLGADAVIDYTREDFTEGGEQYDLILDTAGRRKLSDLRRALTRRGTLVIVGGWGASSARLPGLPRSRSSPARACAASPPRRTAPTWRP